jgi:NAD-dependent dihydropyrimidine dehydrogenase PreA subunit
MLPLPLLDPTRCTGCGDCVPACPADCLAMDGPFPWLPRPLDCISCSLCVLVCPADALRLADGQPIDLADLTAGLDRPELALLLAALAHAAGSHEHREVLRDDDGAPHPGAPLGPVVPWPARY